MLDLVAAYHPSGEAEVYDLMNALEDRLGHVNSAVVMAALKVFLHLTLNMTATHQQVSGGKERRGGERRGGREGGIRQQLELVFVMSGTDSHLGPCWI